METQVSEYDSSRNPILTQNTPLKGPETPSDGETLEQRSFIPCNSKETFTKNVIDKREPRHLQNRLPIGPRLRRPHCPRYIEYRQGL
jgi:hypothetical protein